MNDDKAPAPGAAETPGKLGLRAIVVKLWVFLRHPTAVVSVGTLAGTGMVLGVLGWGGFNWAMEITNTESFCISCHEMERNVFREYKGSVHDANASGVRATCPDCHVPRPWVHKIVRKIQASNELYHHFLGTIDTREKYEERRLYLAKRVWTVMKETDSRECRNCHGFDGMDVSLQPTRARENHLKAIDDGRTCIDCHKGIAHELPEGALEAERELNESWKSR